MPKTRHEAVRTCVACRREAGKGTLVRFVRDASGAVVEDPSGRAPGRGAYLHDDPACRELALKKRSLERALRGVGRAQAAPSMANRGDVPPPIKLRNTKKGDNP